MAEPSPFAMSPAPQLAAVTVEDVAWAAAGGFARAPEHHVFFARPGRRLSYRHRGPVEFSFAEAFQASLRRIEQAHAGPAVSEFVQSARMSNTVMHSTTPPGACARWFQVDGATDQDTFRLTDELRREAMQGGAAKAPASAHLRHTIKLPRRGCGKSKRPYHPLQQIMTFGNNARPAHQVSLVFWVWGRGDSGWA